MPLSVYFRPTWLLSYHWTSVSISLWQYEAGWGKTTNCLNCSLSLSTALYHRGSDITFPMWPTCINASLVKDVDACKNAKRPFFLGILVAMQRLQNTGTRELLWTPSTSSRGRYTWCHVVTFPLKQEGSGVHCTPSVLMSVRHVIFFFFQLWHIYVTSLIQEFASFFMVRCVCLFFLHYF